MKALNWQAVSSSEKKRAQGFVLIGEYEMFYLYEKRDRNNKPLYRECFSKFDIDGAVKNQIQPNKKSKIRHYKTMLS